VGAKNPPYEVAEEKTSIDFTGKREVIRGAEHMVVLVAEWG